MIKQRRSGRSWAHLKSALMMGRVALSRGQAAARAGEALRAELDGMKGMAMKIGQIVSYLEVPLPDEARAALAALQTGATAMAWDTTRAIIEVELGAPIEVLFSAIDEVPVAAASIGQVHRATIGDEAVAVKVRYPWVRDSFAADAGGLHRIAGLASLASAVDGHAIVDELGARLDEECDYQREAGWQRAFADAFAGEDAMVIPDVVRSHSSEGVLTTSWLEGHDITRFAAEATPEARNAAAMTLMRFSLRSLLELGTIQADPHPGNYRFLGRAGVGFFDFGCVRSFDDDTLGVVRGSYGALLEGRREDFDELVVRAGFAPRPQRFDFDHHWNIERLAFAPFLSPRFRYERDFLRQAAQGFGPQSPNARSQAMPPAWIWIYRLMWGLHAVLARLQAEADFASVLREVLAKPPSRLASHPRP